LFRVHAALKCWGSCRRSLATVASSAVNMNIQSAEGSVTMS